MELKYKRKSVNIVLCLLLAFLLHKFCQAEELCTVSPEPVTIKENNTIDTLVVQIYTTTKDVTLTLTENPEDAFDLRGSDLMVKKGLDFESLSGTDELTVHVQCNQTGYKIVTLFVVVHVKNINDNPPTFAQTQYTLDVNELTEVNSSIGLFKATDDDSEILYYSMKPTMNRYFRLETENNPNILVHKVIDYDVVQQMTLTLYVQDTPTPTQPGEPSFTATTTITVNVKDIDNRPPWFQPCTKTTIGRAKICLSLGYKGRVNLTERQDGALLLQPGPLYARDGDKSRNEQISYKILKGNEDSIFQIDENTGNITMLKAADIAGPMSLMVLASQVSNRDQFAYTFVTIEVMKKSRSPPRFEKERYEGYVYSNSGPDNMVLRDKTTNRPFRVKARDEDFANGINPDIRYEVQYSSYVNVTMEGFVLLKKAVRTDSFALQLRAVDVSTGESGTAALSVLVLPAVGVQSPSEGYRAGDMALLGFIMAALLVLCIIVIGFLISRLRKGNPDLLKLSEVSTFSSELCPCLKFTQPTRRPRDSMQFTNDGFQNEGDTGRAGPRRLAVIDRRLDTVQAARARVTARERPRHCTSCGLREHTNHMPNSSPVGQAKARLHPDQVKSILSKEKRSDERHKTVWFKENEDSLEIQVEIIPANIGLKLEEDMEEGGEDSSSSAPKASDMELGDLTAMLVQDMGSQGASVSDGKEELKAENADL